MKFKEIITDKDIINVEVQLKGLYIASTWCKEVEVDYIRELDNYMVTCRGNCAMDTYYHYIRDYKVVEKPDRCKKIILNIGV